uniref:Uncharacterized protein n=1 Tax=Anser brachyrhynchus TaxID=132585 RepID=A0A8B9BKR7_9AVES
KKEKKKGKEGRKEGKKQRTKKRKKKKRKKETSKTNPLVQYNCCFASIIPTFIKKKGPKGNS